MLNNPEIKDNLPGFEEVVRFLFWSKFRGIAFAF